MNATPELTTAERIAAYRKNMEGSRTDLISPVLFDYWAWDISPEKLEEIKQSRRDAGIHQYDTYNFENFMATTICNGIQAFEQRNHTLRNAGRWDSFKQKHPEITQASFDETLVFIAETLQKYSMDEDSFYKFYGYEQLDEALTLFFIMLPHLRKESRRIGVGFDIEHPDYDEINERDIMLHNSARERFGISTYDAYELDTYLMGVFAIGLEILSNDAHGHPSEMTFEKWQETLRGISKDFKAYHLDRAPLSDDTKLRFIKHFRSMWD